MFQLENTVANDTVAIQKIIIQYYSNNIVATPKQII